MFFHSKHSEVTESLKIIEENNSEIDVSEPLPPIYEIVFSSYIPVNFDEICLRIPEAQDFQLPPNARVIIGKEIIDVLKHMLLQVKGLAIQSHRTHINVDDFAVLSDSKNPGFTKHRSIFRNNVQNFEAIIPQLQCSTHHTKTESIIDPQTLTYLAKSTISLSPILNSVHWLVVEGVQPTIFENPTKVFVAHNDPNNYGSSNEVFLPTALFWSSIRHTLLTSLEDEGKYFVMQEGVPVTHLNAVEWDTDLVALEWTEESDQQFTTPQIITSTKTAVASFKLMIDLVESNDDARFDEVLHIIRLMTVQYFVPRFAVYCVEAFRCHCSGKNPIQMFNILRIVNAFLHNSHLNLRPGFRDFSIVTVSSIVFDGFGPFDEYTEFVKLSLLMRTFATSTLKILFRLYPLMGARSMRFLLDAFEKRYNSATFATLYGCLYGLSKLCFAMLQPCLDKFSVIQQRIENKPSKYGQHLMKLMLIISRSFVLKSSINFRELKNLEPHFNTFSSQVQKFMAHSRSSNVLEGELASENTEQIKNVCRKALAKMRKVLESENFDNLQNADISM